MDSRPYPWEKREIQQHGRELPAAEDVLANTPLNRAQRRKLAREKKGREALLEQQRDAALARIAELESGTSAIVDALEGVVRIIDREIYCINIGDADCDMLNRADALLRAHGRGGRTVESLRGSASDEPAVITEQMVRDVWLALEERIAQLRGGTPLIDLEMVTESGLWSILETDDGYVINALLSDAGPDDIAEFVLGSRQPAEARRDG